MRLAFFYITLYNLKKCRARLRILPRNAELPRTRWIMSKNENEDKKYNRELLRNLYMISQMGVTIAACILIGVLLGRFLDNLAGTSPFLLIFFSLVGAGAGFRSIFQLANKDQ